MRIYGMAIAAVVMAGCAADPPPPAQRPAPGSRVETTSSDVMGPGISGSTEHGLTYGPDGTPYKPNQDPTNPGSNREQRKDQKDVRTAPNAE